MCICAQADHAERLAAQLSAPDQAPLPPSLAHGSIRRRDPASGCQQQAKCELGRGQRIAGRGIEDGYAPSCRRGEIDVVDADASSADDLESRARSVRLISV